MRIHLISDLHLEGRDAVPADVDADITCICGDIGYWVGRQSARVATFLRAIQRPVYLVLGNHDFYYTTNRPAHMRTGLDMCFAEVLTQCPNATLLHNSWTRVPAEGGADSVLLFGSPLWTGLTTDAAIRKAVSGGITDFRHNLQMAGYRSWTLDDHVAAHEASEKSMRAWFECSRGAKRVVMTHWLPSERCVAPRWRGHPLNAYFVAQMDEMIEREQPDLWMFGHTHDHVDVRIGRTRLVANPRGYAGEDSRFDPGLVIEV